MRGRAAVELAEAGTQAWRDTAGAQRTAASDHGEFYALAGELVATLRALEALADVLIRRVATYEQGRVLRDDEGAQPAARLASAVADLTRVRELLAGAERAANRFWSEIGHIGIEEQQ